MSNSQNLGKLAGNLTKSDFIGAVDLDDYYRFNLDKVSDFIATVNGLDQGNLTVYLGQDSNNDGTISFDEIIAISEDLAGNTPGEINVTGLAIGSYYIWLSRGSGNTNYNLNLSATPSVIPTDKAGSTLATAFNLGSLTTSIQKEFVGNVDPIDYYRFNFANPSGLTLNLSGLSTDIDLELSQDKDSDGLISSDEIIQVSELTENQDETIDIAALPAGNYFAKVSQYEGDTTYDLSLTPKTAVGADLQVTVTPITTPLTLGDTVSYTVTVKNIGASTATGVALKDNFPLASVLDVSVKVSQGSGTISDTEISVDIGSLNVSESATLIVSGRLIGSGPFSSLIEASSLDIDFNLDNNSVVQRYRVTPGIIPPSDLELVLTSDKKTANLDEVVTLRMTLTNKGPGTATAIQVKSLLPQELTFVSSTPQQGSYDATTGIWDAGNIAKNNKAFVDIVAKVNSTAQTSVISEIIGVAESDPDSTPNNNNLTEDDQSQIVINNNITVIESIGNTKLVKNAEKYLFAQVGDNISIPIMLPNDFSFLGGAITSNTKVQLYEGMSPSWNAIAAETVNGKNQVLLKNTGTKALSVLPFDSNWEWVLDLSESLWSWDSPAALNQENNFGVDANGDGRIGVPVTVSSSVTLAVTPNSVTKDGTANLVYTFTRTGSTTNALTVNYSITGTATNGTDYTTIGTSIAFAANSATATLTLDPTTDTTIELDETAILTLATGTGYTIGTTTSVTGTITNDDLPAITLAVSPANVTEDSTTNLVYTFTRTGLIANALTVTYGITGTADSSDYTGTTPGTGKTITFAANSATATVTLDTTADTTIEPDETVILTLASEAGYTIGTTTPITGTITNDDVASYRDKLTTPIIRFQNTDKPGTYLFAGEQEAASIRQNYKGFKEEGLAFQVAVNKDDPLMQPFYRFQNTTKGREGTYLFADEKEAISIRQNYKNFVEEGLAFYAYSAGVGGGTTDFTRFQNKNAPGTYLFTGPSETSSVLTNFPGFTLEGSAFAAG